MALNMELQQRQTEQEKLLAQRDDVSSQLQEVNRANSRLLEQVTELGQEKDKLQQELEETRKTADKRQAMLDELAIDVAQEKSRYKEELSDVRLQHEKEAEPVCGDMCLAAPIARSAPITCTRGPRRPYPSPNSARPSGSPPGPRGPLPCCSSTSSGAPQGPCSRADGPAAPRPLHPKQPAPEGYLSSVLEASEEDVSYIMLYSNYTPCDEAPSLCASSMTRFLEHHPWVRLDLLFSQLYRPALPENQAGLRALAALWPRLTLSPISGGAWAQLQRRFVRDTAPAGPPTRPDARPHRRRPPQRRPHLRHHRRRPRLPGPGPALPQD
ncbi:hypothetical protein AAFF_G00005010 [Aldrovandia affinis]|uniref:Uncharacterized protein n=1 Tax=Aldrovandia affinis TaxID=143900 RepID=A0AAD7TEB9_9TELE|nr:hypothetical protein AAFF_G00005010 [Aldrovandia affinis]